MTAKTQSPTCGVTTTSSSSHARILIVDDCSTYRRLVRSVLDDISQAEVIGEAKDGIEAVELAERLKPDILLLDVEMPGLDGIEVLAELRKRKSASKSIMLSSLTKRGAEPTTEALMEGAFDFIHKPMSDSWEESSIILRSELLSKLGAYRQAKRPSSTASRQPEAPAASRPRTAIDAVCIGASTGGPNALKQLLADLPGSLPFPILIAQHMPPHFTASMAKSLDKNCELQVQEAVDDMPVEKGNVYVAPGGRQMGVERRSLSNIRICVDDGSPEMAFRPSVNYLFRSAAATFGPKLFGVILTGMGCDGSEGAGDIRDRGGRIFVQDSASCAVDGMPSSARNAGVVDATATLDTIAEEIRALGLISAI
ncbi:MAG: chemotaxis-specific protein-glutamate methyltransferase CheB [Planctomycetales bacterium]|nr:chemotaxis-specific protein-glutamate methyltransferase CheB [Planctomycetales bacterium]